MFLSQARNLIIRLNVTADNSVRRAPRKYVPYVRTRRDVVEDVAAFALFITGASISTYGLVNLYKNHLEKKRKGTQS